MQSNLFMNPTLWIGDLRMGISRFSSSTPPGTPTEPGTTPAGAVFESDGTGVGSGPGLYYQPPGNGIPILLSGGSGSINYYKGLWSAASNTPTVGPTGNTNGDMWIVLAGGTQTIDGAGPKMFSVGEAIVWNSATSEWNTITGSGGTGSSGLITVTVNVPDNAVLAAAVPIPMTAKSGSYVFVIAPVVSGGARAVFTTTSTTDGAGEDTTRTSSSVATPGSEELGLTWPTNGFPSLYHRVGRTGGTGALLAYRVSILYPVP